MTSGIGRAARSTAGLGAVGILLAGLVALGTLTRPGPIHVAMSGDHEQVSAQSRPATVIRPLSCTPLKDIPGKSVSTVRVEFPPLASSPPHRHPGSVTAYVLKGTLRSQLAGEAARTYMAGETWFEPMGALHQLAENPSATEPAELLAVFVADSACGPLVIPE